MTTKSDLEALLYKKTASEPGLDPILLSAIIEVESAWVPSRMKFEPGFTYLCKEQEMALKNGVDLPTERCLQRFSYGLGQIMGGTARELGFSGPLPELLDPSVNMEYMLRYFQKKCDEYVYQEDQIAAYNAGSVRRLKSGIYMNQGYVNKVLKVLAGNPAWQARKSVGPSPKMPN